MSHDPKSSSRTETTLDPNEISMEMSEFGCLKTICQDTSTLRDSNFNQFPKLTKELIFGNLRSYENIVTTVKCLAKYQSDKVKILNNNTIVIQRKLNANNSLPFVKYEIMLINDEDDDSEDDDDDDDECGDNKSDSGIDGCDVDKNDLRKCMF